MLDVQAKTPLGLASRPARAEQPWHQDLCRVVSVFILDWFLVLTLYHILAVRCRQECKWHCERQQSLLIVVFLMLRVIDLLRLFHLFRREQQQLLPVFRYPFHHGIVIILFQFTSRKVKAHIKTRYRYAPTAEVGIQDFIAPLRVVSQEPFVEGHGFLRGVNSCLIRFEKSLVSWL